MMPKDVDPVTSIVSKKTSMNNSLNETKGLTAKQAQELLEKYGPNKLPETPPPSKVELFLSQLKNPLVYILIIAGIITALLQELADTAIIFLAVFINTILGFVQESRANNALSALKKLIHPTATVLRDGQPTTVPIEQIVVGDVVLLKQGDKIPADGQLIITNRFFVNEAMLTGESEAANKNEEDLVFMGTIVTAGRAQIIVKNTGANTEMGKIAQSISDSDTNTTPLGKQLVKFSKQLSVLVLFLILLVFVIGLLNGTPLVEIFKTSVALAVSAIPEGLLVGLTVVLALGMKRILGRKGLVRNLVSAETLGGVTTICVDKTGTLTEGKMQVVNVLGDQNKIAEHVVLANDLDTGTVIAAWEWGKDKAGHGEHTNLTRADRLDSIPFSSEYKLSASLYPFESNNLLYVTGAPDKILEYSTLSVEQKNEIKSQIDEMAQKGQRMLAFATKQIEPTKTHLELADAKTNLEWVGLLSFTDPIRDDVKDNLKLTKQAGINLIVITGDYSKTALAVLRQLDIQVSDEDVIVGKELSAMSPLELKDRLFKNKGSVKLFARTKPHQKLKIIEVLKESGEIVAMMGDGVNDAPALSKADIGIVVGEATDVAKESADLVLLDSSFSTIVAAIEEGRGIFDNIRKIILYLMSDAFEEILLVLSALILGLPLPITAIQILWINLVSDGFPHLALTVDPKTPGVMQRGPRSPNEALVSKWMFELMAIGSFFGFMFSLGLFIMAYQQTASIDFARSVAFVSVGINSLLYVFSVRTLKEPIWVQNFLSNKWLIIAIFFGAFFQILPFLVPALTDAFGLEQIGIYWFYIFVVSILMVILFEIFKLFFRKKLA